MSEIIRHGSIMQDVLEDGITPPDIVDKITVQHGSKMPESESTGGGSGGQFIVNIHVDWANSTDGRFSATCDKTPAEMSAAIMSGIVPVGHAHLDGGIYVVNYSHYLPGDHDEIAEVVFIKSMFDPMVNGEEVQSINVAFDKISIGSDGHGYYEYSYGTIPATVN